MKETKDPCNKRYVFGTKGYHLFEKIVVAALTLMVIASVILSLMQAGMDLYHVVTTGPDVMDHDAFIHVFGSFMTVLIALEFNHTVLPEISGGTPIVKVQAVLLVALLALSRKVVLVDYKMTDFTSLIGIAVMIAAITGAYWVTSHIDLAKQRKENG